MRLILFFLFSFIVFFGYGQDTTGFQPMAAKGYKFKRVRADSSLNIPSDTSSNKLGIARIGSTLYVGNGTKWTAAVSGATTVIDSVTFVSSTCADTVKYWISGVSYYSGVIDRVNGLLNGGEVELVDSTMYNVFSAVYRLSCVRYRTNNQTVLLNKNTSGQPRIDIIGVNTSSTAFVRQGIPAANPQTPSVDPLTEIGLVSVYFPANSDTATIVNIYNNYTFEGTDSTAFHNLTQLNDTTAIWCDLQGRCDTLIVRNTANWATLQNLSDSINYIKTLIPAQFNPIAGTNVTITGTYPNITFSASGSGGSNFTAGSNIQITGTSPNFTISAQKQFNSEINTFTQNNKFARIFAGVIRPNCPGANQPITWSFIDTTAYHNWINFDSVKGAGSQIQVYFQRAKNIVSFVAVPDESLALAGVQLGASVGDSVAIISPYTLRQPCGDFVGSDTGWVTTGIATSFRDYDPSTGITRFTPTLPGSRTIYNVSPETYGTQITYVGPRNYRVRRIYSGLTSSQLIAFYLVDSVNNIVTGSLATTDRVVITVPRMGTEAIPSQTSASTGYPCDIYGGSSNIWLMAVMEMPIIGYPLDSSSVKLEWQVARKGGGNFATSYRITRATESSPNTETNIYTGSALIFTDTGLSKGTRYLYRMYATILGVESRVGYEHVKTLNE